MTGAAQPALAHRRPIIVGYDGSPGSHDALALAGPLSAAAGRRLALVAVQARGEEPAPEREARREALHETLTAAPAPADVERHVFEGRSVAEGLLAFAEVSDAAAVVVGSSGQADQRRTALGSVATHLLHGSPCAVAVAPLGYRDGQGGPLRHLIVGYVDSDEARAALRAAAGLAVAADGEVTVVSVRRPAAPHSGSPESEHLDATLRALASKVPVQALVGEGDPAPRLLEEAARGGDAIVMGSRGHGPARQVLLGSVAALVLAEATVPVVVVPAGAQSELVASSDFPDEGERAARSRRAL